MFKNNYIEGDKLGVFPIKIQNKQAHETANY